MGQINGNPLYRVATSQDQRAHQIYNRFWRDEGVQKVIESHQQVESNNNALNTPPVATIYRSQVGICRIGI